MPTETRSTSLPRGWILQAGPFAILGATWIYLRLRWDQIPERFPVHWGIDGLPNGWSARTPVGVYTPLLMGTVILIGISFLSYETLRRSNASDADAGSLAVRLRQNIALRIGLFLAGLDYFLACTFSLVGLLPLTGAPHVHLVLGAVAILIAAFSILSWKMIQAQQRDHAMLASAQAHVSSGAIAAREDNWKMGMFYCNPDDPTIWVEKRSGLGSTLNFARGASWVLLAALLVLPLGVALFAIWHR